MHHIFVDDESPNSLSSRSSPPGACEAAVDAAEAFVAHVIAIAERDPRSGGPTRFAPGDELRRDGE